MVHDLKLAVRMLFQSKGWTAVVLLSLALGIGANTALFTAINGMLLRTIAVSQQEKFFASAYSLFGGLALLLASIGLFGLMSYNVARRTNEIGIIIGIGPALSAGTLVTAMIFGLAPTDMLSIVAAVGTMLLVSAIAAYLPARRASRVAPMIALHYD